MSTKNTAKKLAAAVRRLDPDGRIMIEVAIDALASVDKSDHDSAWLSEIALYQPGLLDRAVDVVTRTVA